MVRALFGAADAAAAPKNKNTTAYVYVGDSSDDTNRAFEKLEIVGERRVK